jgi:hypothetical protein
MRLLFLLFPCCSPPAARLAQGQHHVGSPAPAFLAVRTDGGMQDFRPPTPASRWSSLLADWCKYCEAK